MKKSTLLSLIWLFVCFMLQLMDVLPGAISKAQSPISSSDNNTSDSNKDIIISNINTTSRRKSNTVNRNDLIEEYERKSKRKKSIWWRLFQKNKPQPQIEQVDNSTNVTNSNESYPFKTLESVNITVESLRESDVATGIKKKGLNRLKSKINQTLNTTDVIETNRTLLPSKIETTENNLKVRHLFQQFAFKGFGLTATKSFLNLHGCSVGILIPITSNFPLYDRIVYLPKLGSILSVSYPWNLRLSFSLSLPVQVVWYGTIFAAARMRGVSRNRLRRALQGILGSDINERMGLSFSLRYDGKGISSTYGIYFLHMTNKTQVYKNRVLGTALYGVAFFYMLLNVIVDLETRTVLDTSMLSDNEMANYMNQSSSLSTSVLYQEVISTNKYFKKSIYNHKRHGIKFWQQIWMQWAILKNFVFKMNFGLYHSSENKAFLSSNAGINLQPYFPLLNLVKTKKGKLKVGGRKNRLATSNI